MTNTATTNEEQTQETPRQPIEHRPTLMVVDGYALIYRAYHALPASLASPGGEPTNAVMGFTTMLLDTLRKQRPEYVAVAFDRGRTFRHEAYAEYKATRAAMPDDLRQQIGRVREIIAALKMPIFECEGFEADDVIGTLARIAESEGLRTLVVTGDMDELQLVTPNVDVLTPTGRNRFDETKLYDPEAVMERYGFEPLRLPDYKALIGDKSDNIPGVRGIGEKGATTLIAEYGTLENMIAHLDEIKPAKTQQALRDNADQAVKSKYLATIVRDVPVVLNLEECRAEDFDRDRLVDLFRELGFRRLVEKLPGAPPRPEPQPVAPPKGGARQLSMFEQAPKAETDGATPETPAIPEGYTVVRTREQLDALAQRLKESARFVFDIETTSKEEMQGDMVGIAIAPQPGESYYIPVGHLEGEQLPLAEVQAVIAPIMAATKPLKDAHNAKYDIIMMARNGMPVGDGSLGYDTMIAAYLLGEQSKGLKDLAFTHLRIEMTPITNLIGTGRNQITMDRVDIDKAAAYAAADADMTFRLQELLIPRLRDEPDLWSLFSNLEMPLVPVLTDMELAGVYVDVTQLQNLSTELFARMRDLEQQIYDFAGHPFNINSSQQLGTVLFDEIGLQQGRSRTKTGYSTAQEVLDTIRSLHPIVDLVSEWRSMNKLKSTYLDALPLLVNAETGRVHTSFNQTVAATGRLSSTNPNMQNIPIRTEVGRLVRRAFVADNSSKKPLVSRPAVLLAADYSQIELRILAHMTGEDTLVNAFLNGQDVHAATAAELFDVPLSEVKPEMRYLAKRINFGVLYGMGTYGLTRDTELDMAQAKEFIERYWSRLPKIRTFLDDILREAKKQGYVSTLLGRRRYMYELKSPNIGVRQAAERAAINAPVQGTAADIIKIAMIRLNQELHKRKLEARMLLQVHDELLFELPESELAEVEPLVRETMEGAFPMNVPLRVEMKHGKSWGEME